MTTRPTLWHRYGRRSSAIDITQSRLCLDWKAARRLCWWEDGRIKAVRDLFIGSPSTPPILTMEFFIAGLSIFSRFDGNDSLLLTSAGVLVQAAMEGSWVRRRRAHAPPLHGPAPIVDDGISRGHRERPITGDRPVNGEANGRGQGLRGVQVDAIQGGRSMVIGGGQSREAGACRSKRRRSGSDRRLRRWREEPTLRRQRSQDRAA